MTSLRIAIAGAGVAGLCLAVTLLRRGQRVTLYDPASAEETASWAAAGMLAPTYEAATDSPGHPEMYGLLESARDLGDEGPQSLGIERQQIGLMLSSSVALAVSAGQASMFRRLAKHGRARALDVGDLASLGNVNPDGFVAAFWLPRDGQVDNRAFVRRLTQKVLSLGGERQSLAVEPAKVAPGDLSADCIVDARGWRAPAMTPVKGTAMALARHPGLPGHVVRWGRNYLVPKADRVVLGAHAMPGLTDTSVDPAIIDELCEEAALIFPAVKDADVLETWSGVRPRSADGAPVLGWTGPGHYQLGGLYRDGFLLAPRLADWAASDILGDVLPDLARRFTPDRFKVRA